MLADFAENFKFVIQDKIQSYHWSQHQCMLHPIDGTLKVQMNLSFQCDQYALYQMI